MRRGGTFTPIGSRPSGEGQASVSDLRPGLLYRKSFANEECGANFVVLLTGVLCGWGARTVPRVLLLRCMRMKSMACLIETMPKTGVPCVLGLDANTPVKWVLCEDKLEATGRERKGENMIEKMSERGLSLTAPLASQRSLPTCHPRNAEAQGRHIDVVGGIGCRTQGLGIVENSCLFVGSDHDMVLQGLELREKGKKVRRKPQTRPRFVYSDVQVPEKIDPGSLALHGQDVH